MESTENTAVAAKLDRIGQELRRIRILFSALVFAFFGGVFVSFLGVVVLFFGLPPRARIDLGRTALVVCVIASVIYLYGYLTSKLAAIREANKDVRSSRNRDS